MKSIIVIISLSILGSALTRTQEFRQCMRVVGETDAETCAACYNQAPFNRALINGSCQYYPTTSISGCQFYDPTWNGSTITENTCLKCAATTPW